MSGWLPFLGLLIAQLVLLGLYFLKLRADDKRRWHKRKIDAYSAFTRDVGEFVRAASRDFPHQPDADFSKARFDSLQHRYYEIILMSSGEVRAAADELLNRSSYTMGVTHRDLDGALDLLLAQQDFFIDRARVELGIPDPVVRTSLV